MDGRILKIRQASTPAPPTGTSIGVLQLPAEMMKPVKTWSDSEATRA